jgi:type III restriction enzyme
VNFTLKNYQATAVTELAKFLRRAGQQYEDDPNDLFSLALSAPTGAGKTVIASAVIETLFDGDGNFSADPLATVLWVTDDPALNAQTIRNMNQASSKLGPNRLIAIRSDFDQECFEPNKVYFLNIQKLARTNSLSRSNVDGRTYSLWETISNTINSVGAHYYVVIDEAHRGMKTNSDRPTIVARIINGQPNINPPAPIVWGISATPERFNEAIAKWGTQRTNRHVTVPLDEVRASGLIKDKIVLDNPQQGQMQSDTTLLRRGVRQILAFEDAWQQYTVTQNEPPVIPAFVVQVPNTPTEAEMAEWLNAIFDAWDGLKDSNVVNTFGEHVALSAGGHTIQYMAPQDIQDDNSIRVVLCKDAISTGWDCPRAEVLVSMRGAQDYTYIAQLIGRMVRTPLARRIPSKHTLNDVHCYLPRFNKDQVNGIVARFAEGKSDEPPVEIVVNPIVLERNHAVPDEVAELLQSLPTYVVPGRIYRSQISRLHTLAALLSGDHIVEDAVAQARIAMVGVLKSERARLENDGSFQLALTRVRSLRIDRSYVLLAVERLEDLPPDDDRVMERDDNNIEDLFRVAKRKLPEGVATNYWNEVIESQDDDDYDPTEAKAVTAVLALHSEVIDAVEAAAEQLVRNWLSKHQKSISKLPDAKKALYEPVKRETRTPELTDLIVPTSMTVSDQVNHWKRHVLAAQDGNYPFTGKTWEHRILEHELKDKDLVGWYRNPTGGTGAVRVPWDGGKFDRSMYPDFVMFHQTDEGIKASLIDPHGPHLSDALGKLKGFVEYASAHCAAYHRMESVAEIGGKLKALDVRSATVRDAVQKYKDADIKPLYEKYGGDYS